jgi:hypothetical protein
LATGAFFTCKAKCIEEAAPFFVGFTIQEFRSAITLKLIRRSLTNSIQEKKDAPQKNAINEA